MKGSGYCRPLVLDQLHQKLFCRRRQQGKNDDAFACDVLEKMLLGQLNGSCDEAAIAQQIAPRRRGADHFQF